MDYSPTDRCVRQTSAHAHDSYDLDPQSVWICSKKNAFSNQHRKMLIMWICSKWMDKSISMEAFLATCHFFLFRKFHGFPASSGRPRRNTGGRGAEGGVGFGTSKSEAGKFGREKLLTGKQILWPFRLSLEQIHRTWRFDVTAVVTVLIAQFGEYFDDALGAAQCQT